MNRFTEIIQTLREQRFSLLEMSRKKRHRAFSSGGRRKKAKGLSFDSPELEKIFNSLPNGMKGLLKEV